MKVKELLAKKLFDECAVSGNVEEDIKGVFCCDLLSVAMGSASAHTAWVTVMSNINTLAVASLIDASVIVLAEGVVPSESMKQKAIEKNITVLLSKEPVFETALKIHNLISKETG